MNGESQEWKRSEVKQRIGKEGMPQGMNTSKNCGKQ